jgi:Flp pilus assembly protein TadD
VVDVGNDKKALDLGIQFRRLPVFRYVSDLEIVAHYYNNLGYAVIHQAEVDNRPVAWLEVARLFRIAVHVVPHFARAWNNLGVAYSRLGRTTQAMACYRQAIRSDPQMVSAFSNLGVLFLSEERFAEAIAVLEQAIALNPDQESLRERLGKACHRLGRVSSPSPIDICPIPR